MKSNYAEDGNFSPALIQDGVKSDQHCQQGHDEHCTAHQGERYIGIAKQAPQFLQCESWNDRSERFFSIVVDLPLQQESIYRRSRLDEESAEILNMQIFLANLGRWDLFSGRRWHAIGSV